MQIDLELKLLVLHLNPDSILLKASDIKLSFPKVKEADHK